MFTYFNLIMLSNTTEEVVDTLIVSNLDPSFEEGDICTIFREFPIKQLVKEQDIWRIVFVQHSAAEKALREYNNAKVNGRIMKCHIESTFVTYTSAQKSIMHDLFICKEKIPLFLQLINESKGKIITEEMLSSIMNACKL